MRNITGTPVDGDNFFGRQAELAELLRLLDDHDILLLGPRRVGKTSIGRRLMAEVQAQKNWLAVEVNVASCNHERELVAKLARALTDAQAHLGLRLLSGVADAWKATLGRIQQIKVGVPGVADMAVQLQAGPAPAEWTVVASELLGLLSQVNTRWLIYIDELPIFLYGLMKNDKTHGTARVRRFLDWFRNDVCQLPAHNQVRWLVSGSVGLDTLAQHHGMADSINSLHHTSLREFSPTEALALLQALQADTPLGLDDDALTEAVREVQWLQPYYLQQVFHHLRHTSPQASGSHRVRAAVQRLAEPGQDNDFHHWEARLDEQLGAADGGHARALLTLAARQRAGASATLLFDLLHSRLPADTPKEQAHTQFVRLRDVLIRDAYWGRVDMDSPAAPAHYQFRLEPLRRWWLRRNTL